MFHERSPASGALGPFSVYLINVEGGGLYMVIRPEKVAMIEELKATLKNAKGVVLADFRGIKVAQDTKLRRKMREAGVEYLVIKNNMASICLLYTSDAADE